MDTVTGALAKIPGGRVLDVATGRGGSAGVLQRRLRSYTEIVGIDVYEPAIKAAQDSYGSDRVRFVRMDAEVLAFRDHSFDTVNAAKSLHHWANVPLVLSEMKRVLKPGGRLLIYDMHRAVQTEAQRTDMGIHHLAAQVDTAFGFPHNLTFARQEIVDLIEASGFVNVLCYDESDTESDPMDAEGIREKEEIIGRILERAKSLPGYQEFRHQGEELRLRLHRTGIQSEPVLLVIGQKP
jgi:SAM-dependent methyltransferase